MPDFVKIASTSDIGPGQSIVVEVEGRPIAVFNVNGEFVALDNVCVHRGGPLGEGFVDAQNMAVQCPWHGWSYSLQDGKCQNNPGAAVEKFEVKLEGTDVMLALN
jgi:nitrite reductase (NADH) small subunit